jgi:hypothetical protein
MTSIQVVVIVLVVVVVVVIATIISLSVVFVTQPNNNSNDVQGSNYKNDLPQDDVPSETYYVTLPTSFLQSTNFTLADINEGSGSFSSQNITVELPKSQPDTLVTLVLLGPADHPKSFQPVGRSYDGRDWETSAGPFAGKVVFDCPNTTEGTTTCLIELPRLPTINSAIYQVTLFDKPNYADRDIVARFLEQATFGGSRKDINAFFTDDEKKNGQTIKETTPLDTTLSFAKWIKNQQTTVPIMSHREIYRRHLNAQFPVPNPMGAVTLPCQRNSRYRLSAFTIKDINRPLTIKTLNSSTERQRALLLDGHLRTVVGPDIYMYDENWNVQPFPNLFVDATYRVCWVI